MCVDPGMVATYADARRFNKRPIVARCAGVRRTVSAIRSDRSYGSVLQRMGLGLRTPPIVLPGGQINADLGGILVCESLVG